MRGTVPFSSVCNIKFLSILEDVILTNNEVLKVHYNDFNFLSYDYWCSTKMAKGLIWATAEDLARNRARVLSLYRQLLRSLNSPDLPLNLAARLAKKAEVRAIFVVASEERSLHNIGDLIDTAEYSLSVLRQGKIPQTIPVY